MSKKKQKIDSAYYVSLIERITTVHGTSHFTSMRGRSLVLWSLAVVGTAMLTIAFIMVIKQKFNENQIVTAVSKIIFAVDCRLFGKFKASFLVNGLYFELRLIL